MHGKGTYIWKDGRKYEGEYQNDKKHVIVKFDCRDMVFILGLTEGGTKENGETGSNMVGRNIF